MRNLHVYILSFVLCVAGLSLFLYKTFVTGLPLLPGTLASAWEIEKRINFDASGGPVKLVVNIPGDSPGIHLVTESIVAPKYGVSKSKKKGNRQVTLARREASGPQTVYIRTIASLVDILDTTAGVDPPIVPKTVLSDAQRAAADAILEAADAKSSDTPTLVTEVLSLLASDENTRAVTEAGDLSNPDMLKANAAVTLLALKKIAARQVRGLNLKATRGTADVVYWLEVFDNGSWQSFSLDKKEAGVPATYMAWSRGSGKDSWLSGGSNLRTTYSLVRLEQDELSMVLARGAKRKDELITFSLFSLPLATQDVYRVLLVIPIGIFILVLLRNVVGVQSLGTFMPVLIALAFRETQLFWGIILFSTVVATGLLFRFYLEQLKLLLVPRLASVLIFVVILMAVLSVVTNALGFQRGLSVALFPMVIMAMTIERVSVLWDERGAGEAIKQAVGSLAIASLCHIVMTIPAVEHLMFTFPELLLLLLAGTVLLGRYTGYRLLELGRFRELAKEGS